MVDYCVSPTFSFFVGMHYLYVMLVGFASRPAGVLFGSWQMGVVLGKSTVLGKFILEYMSSDNSLLLKSSFIVANFRELSMQLGLNLQTTFL